jgi:hypothetical protein
MQSEIKHNRLALLSSLVAGVSILAACGGGGGGGGNTPAAARANPTEIRTGIEIDYQFERAQAITTWTPIATEGQSISNWANSTVRYGAGANWVTKVVGSDQAACSNEYFGSDPAFGIAKGCEVQGGGTTTSSGWTLITNEGGNFTVTDNSTVRYGADGYWVSKAVSGQGTCSNEYFGVDPLVGAKKACYVEADNVAAPTAVTPTESTAGSANLTWSASPTSGVSSYRVYYGTASHTYAQNMGSGLLGGSTSYSVTGLTSGKTYYFAVTAIDSSGRESGYSNEAAAVIK